MTEPTAPETDAGNPPTKQPRGFPTIPVPNFHNIASLFETLAFIVADVLYLMNNGADQNHAIATALFGAIFHAYNH